MQNFIKKTIIASALSTFALCGSAHANVYFELGLTQVSDSVQGTSIDHFAAITAVGTTLTKTDTFAHKVEGIGIFGLNTDKVNGFDVKLQSVLGAAYRPTLKLNDAIDIYGRVGVFNGKAKVSGFGRSVSDSSTEIGFGVGIDFKYFSLSYLNVDGTNLLNATYRF